MNNDGAADVVVLQDTTAAPQVVVFLNQGGGRFVRDNGPIIESGETTAFELADLDADGTLDLITANATAGRVFVRRGAGTGSFSFSTL